MTNKKIDIWIRFILYLFPLIFGVGLIFSHFKNPAGTETFNSETITTWLTRFRGVLDFTINNNSPFKPFFDWFNTNIVHVTNSALMNTITEYCFYLVYVEIALLFKNVLLFIIRVANQMIERGAEIGK